MDRKLLIVTGLAAGTLFTMCQAHAAQISVGGSTSGSATFTGTGTSGSPPDAISFSTSGFSGTANYDGDSLGTYSLGALSFTSQTVSGNNFAISPAVTESFSFTGGDGDTLSGTATWNLLEDNTFTPKIADNALFLNLAITSSSGDSAFLADFRTGGTAQIDLTFSSLTPSPGNLRLFLDQLASTTESETAGISSGEVVPSASIPEPASLTLFGAALVGLGWFGRRRSRV